MKANDEQFTKIINGTCQFVIPVFQRDYTWQAEPHCAQLWNDIVRVARTNEKHFIGSMVYIATRDTSAGFTRWLLIDGQQRLTTLTTILPRYVITSPTPAGGVRKMIRRPVA